MHLGFTRLYGRAPKGERLYDTESPGNPWAKYFVDWWHEYRWLDCYHERCPGVNTDVFLFYVQEILIPQLWVGAIVLMDNLPVHHAHQVREALVAVGAKLVFLPPYSPDLSPIELCWSFSSNFCVRLLLELVKHWIKL
jgi:hypothetical protein